MSDDDDDEVDDGQEHSKRSMMENEYSLGALQAITLRVRCISRLISILFSPQSNNKLRSRGSYGSSSMPHSYSQLSKNTSIHLGSMSWRRSFKQHMNSVNEEDSADFTIRRLPARMQQNAEPPNALLDDMPTLDMEEERRASYEHYQAINAFLHSIHRPRPTD